MHLIKKFLLLSFLLSGLSAFAGDWYVTTNGTGAGTSWADATNNLQGAITACASNCTVWVGKGIYTGNFTVGPGITVKGKTGSPANVIFDGDAAGTVVQLNSSAWLIGCFVVNGNGWGYFDAGGIVGGSVSNCIISGNENGGAYDCKLYNCIISDNYLVCPAWGGGGANSCTIYNSLIYNNTYNEPDPDEMGAGGGGGCSSCTIYNSTIVSNFIAGWHVTGGGNQGCTLVNSISWDNNAVDSAVTESYSCGAGYSGVGSTTSNPSFVDAANGDYRLITGSPCINAGTNGSWTTMKDLDGNVRIWPPNGAVDMGAYEYGSLCFERDWYVATNGAGKGTSWANATNDLQGAVTACFSNYTVWVSNGLYMPVDELTIKGGVTVRSKTGIPTDVVFDGGSIYGNRRMVTMSPSSWLIGCTVRNADAVGGLDPAGIYSGNSLNCIITANNGELLGAIGGGNYYNCLIAGNGSYQVQLGYNNSFVNCTIAYNHADDDAYDPVDTGNSFTNCIVWGNTWPELGGRNYYSCGAGFTGTGSITNNPLFIGGDDYRLRADSPCINAGINGAWTVDATDLDGGPRIFPTGGTVDMGAYESESTSPYPVFGVSID